MKKIEYSHNQMKSIFISFERLLRNIQEILLLIINKTHNVMHYVE
jgi:hypothetical protein